MADVLAIALDRCVERPFQRRSKLAVETNYSARFYVRIRIKDQRVLPFICCVPPLAHLHVGAFALGRRAARKVRGSCAFVRGGRAASALFFCPSSSARF